MAIEANTCDTACVQRGQTMFLMAIFIVQKYDFSENQMSGELFVKY